jgi:hypothetical protein
MGITPGLDRRREGGGIECVCLLGRDGVFEGLEGWASCYE